MHVVSVSRSGLGFIATCTCGQPFTLRLYEHSADEDARKHGMFTFDHIWDVSS